MAHVQVEILLPVQLQYLLHFRQRHPFGRRLAPPPVIQTANPKFLIALPPAPHLPVADADDFCRLPPGDLPGDGSQNHFLYFHGPLHGGLAVRDHVLHALLPLPPAKRTLHVLIQPDISCANDTGRTPPCVCQPTLVPCSSSLLPTRTAGGATIIDVPVCPKTTRLPGKFATFAPWVLACHWRIAVHDLYLVSRFGQPLPHLFGDHH